MSSEDTVSSHFIYVIIYIRTYTFKETKLYLKTQYYCVSSSISTSSSISYFFIISTKI